MTSDREETENVSCLGEGVITQVHSFSSTISFGENENKTCSRLRVF